MLRMMDVVAMPTSLWEGSSQGPTACSLQLSTLRSAPLLQQSSLPHCLPCSSHRCTHHPPHPAAIFPPGLWLSCLFPFSASGTRRISALYNVPHSEVTGTSGLYLQSHANQLLSAQQPPQTPPCPSLNSSASWARSCLTPPVLSTLSNRPCRAYIRPLTRLNSLGAEDVP